MLSKSTASLLFAATLLALLLGPAEGRTSRRGVIRFSPDGRRVVVVAQRCTVLDPDTWRPRLKIDLPKGVRSVGVDPAVTRLAVLYGGLGTSASVFDLETGQEVASLDIPDDFKATTVVVASVPVVLVTDGTTSRVWRYLDRGERTVDLSGTVAAAWPGAARVVTTDRAGALEFFDLTPPSRALGTWYEWAQTALQPVFPDPASTLAVAFSADGTRLAQRRPLDTVIWDTAAARPLRTLKGDARDESMVALSADGTQVATGFGRWVQLWRAGEDARPRLVPLLPSRFPSSVSRFDAAFDSRGRRLAVLIESTVILWDVDSLTVARVEVVEKDDAVGKIDEILRGREAPPPPILGLAGCKPGETTPDDLTRELGPRDPHSWRSGWYDPRHRVALQVTTGNSGHVNSVELLGDTDMPREPGWVVTSADLSAWATDRGLRLGDSEARLQQLYGKPDTFSSNYGGPEYEGILAADNPGWVLLIFTFDRGRLMKIRLRSSAR